MFSNFKHYGLNKQNRTINYEAFKYEQYFTRSCSKSGKIIKIDVNMFPTIVNIQK